MKLLISECYSCITAAVCSVKIVASSFCDPSLFLCSVWMEQEPSLVDMHEEEEIVSPHKVDPSRLYCEVFSITAML